MVQGVRARLVGGVGVAVLVTGGVVGAAAVAAADTTGTAGADSSLVEDFQYPGAPKILTDHKVKLIAGDGHIVWADCAPEPTGDVRLIHVRTADPSINGGGEVCFKVLATTGLLTLEVPGVFEIRGDGYGGAGTGHTGTATITTQNGSPTPVPLNPDGTVQVGITATPPGPPTTLLKLEITGLASAAL